MKKIYKLICIVSSLTLTSSIFAYGSVPSVSTDEGVYVNLDYYGSIDDVSVVKSCSLNGNNIFVDYGSYEKVTNMTNYAEPKMEDDKITWDLGDNLPERFYYECTLKDSKLILPWTFDISYKLNGVPVKAEELVGEKGTIEINIKAVPNEDASDYYKNNMLLQVVTMINMKDTLSIDAPGAQLQSLGTYKGVLFMGLPGEENEFTIRIGSDNFESQGIEMMMIPGTLNQLKKIKELKESKETLEDCADQVNESLDYILDTFNSMDSGLSQLKSGLKNFNYARQVISESKNDIYDDTDEALDNMDNINSDLDDIIPHIENCENLIYEVNDDINSMVDTSLEFKSDFTKLKNSIIRIQKISDGFKKMIKKFDKLEDDREDLFDDFKDELENGEDSLRNIDKNTSKTIEDLENIENKIDKVKKALKELNESVPEIKTDKSERALEDILSRIENIRKTLSGLSDIADSGSDICSSLQEAVKLCDKYLDAVENQNDNAKKLLTEINNTGDTISETLDKADIFIDKCSNLNDTLNSYKDDSINTLKDSEEVITSLNKGMRSLSKVLRKSKETLKESGKSLDSGSQESLDALDDLIDKSLDSIKDTRSIRKAKNTIKDTIDDEIDKYEEETNVLNMDYEHKLISVTSDENPSPSSIQIILRTQEINKESIENDDSDLEIEEENIGIINRLKAIISNIKSNITQLL